MAVKLLNKQDIRQLSVVGGSQELLDWTLYDTVTVATGGTQVSFKFFQEAVGQGGISLETTNMEIPGQLPAGYQFVAEKIVIIPKPAGALTTSATLVDIFNSLINNGNLQFNIGTRPYLQTPLCNAAGGSLIGFAAGTINAFYAGSRCMVTCKMDVSPVIPANYSFNVSLNYDVAPTLTANVKLQTQLVGKLIRPNQG